MKKECGLYKAHANRCLTVVVQCVGTVVVQRISYQSYHSWEGTPAERSTPCALGVPGKDLTVQIVASLLPCILTIRAYGVDVGLILGTCRIVEC